jgi:class 3 adenylate cyclase
MDLHAASKNPGDRRRLAAIMSADIKGYSQLVGRDEEGTIARVTKQFAEICFPIVEEHGGRIFKTTGDGFLAVFNSSLEAVRCAVAFQKRVAQDNAEFSSKPPLQYRIGINVGDVITTSDDFYGDSVNVAARVQTAADPGGICVSASVYVQVKNALPCHYTSLGERKFKNIADAVPLYSVVVNVAPATFAMRALRAAPRAAVVLAVAAFGWVALTNAPALQQASEALLHTISAALPASYIGSRPDPTEQHEIVFKRLIAMMQSDRYNWRTVERLAIESGVSEAEVHEILAAHPSEIQLGKSHDGRLIARLSER